MCRGDDEIDEIAYFTVRWKTRLVLSTAPADPSAGGARDEAAKAPSGVGSGMGVPSPAD